LAITIAIRAQVALSAVTIMRLSEVMLRPLKRYVFATLAWLIYAETIFKYVATFKY